jgi:hypothetical protein
MPILTVRSIALVALMAVFVPLGSACYAEEDVAPPEYAEGYQPQFYDGYVVYYDDGGRPYYYANGGVAWVPQTSPMYVGLVGHWRAYGPAYRGWYAHRGYRYRSYRRGYRR